MSKILIDVKDHHIAKGKCKSPQHCAIAEAIREEYSGVDYVAVRTSGITISSRNPDGSGCRWHYAVPARIAKAILAFDAGETIEPFRFNAKIVDTVPVKPLTPEQRNRMYAKQAERLTRRKAAGLPKPRAGRIAGV